MSRHLANRVTKIEHSINVLYLMERFVIILRLGGLNYVFLNFTQVPWTAY